VRTGLPKLLITGGAGFMGSTFAGIALGAGYKISIADNLSYAGDLKRLGGIKQKYGFRKADICNTKQIRQIFEKEKPDIVVNFAAQTHVDRSILEGKTFTKTNLLGTQVLLDASKKYAIKKFIHISSDEVYGDILRGAFSEASPLEPNSPYAASKAAADLLIRSYVRTYAFPAVIVRPCNNYGPWQYPEKLIPLAVLKILRREKVPLYADGKNRREWLYVEDCARGILKVLQEARVGEVYNLGSNEERENIEVVKMIISILGAPQDSFEFVRDRPGHDIRYRLNSRKLRRELDWQPRVSFKQGLKDTVRWCVKNRKWLLGKWESIRALYR